MNRVIDWAKTHPRLAAWIVLGLGMDGIVAYEARDVGLQAGQWIALLVATTLVAGLCVWIIGWEDEDEAQPSSEAAPQTPPPPPAAGAKPAPARKAAPKKSAANKTAPKRSASKKGRK